jgi:HEAT repeat protein
VQHSEEFANSFAQLTSLLVRKPDERDRQKRALTDALRCAADLPVLLIRDGDTLLADGVPISQGAMDTLELLDRMAYHRIVRLDVDAQPRPADLLALARCLAAPAGPSGDGIQERLDVLHALSVRVAPEDELAERVAPSDPRPQLIVETSPLLESFEVMAEADMLSRVQERARDTATPVSVPAYREFSGPMAGVSVEQLIAALRKASDADTLGNVLQALVSLADVATEKGGIDEAAAIALALQQRMQTETDPEIKAQVGGTLRRVATRRLAVEVISRLAVDVSRLKEYTAVLANAGDWVIDPLTSRLADSENAKERRAVFSVLTHFSSAIPVFVHMLGDRRWYVVRNAADLLAQFEAPDADMALIDALGNADPRARRSVVAALSRIPSRRAQSSLRRSLQDKAPEVRLAAAAGAGRHRNADLAKALVTALDTEQDADVQIALLGAMGKQATPEAVACLIESASPGGLLAIRKRSPAFRLAAVRGLKEAGTTAAVKALRALADDKDASVRAAARSAPAPRTS